MNADVTMKNEPKTILVVDDEEGVREVVKEIISNMGYTVHGAESGEAALSLVSQTEIDLVISDVRMNGMDGLALVRSLRKQFPELPLALMTAYPSEDVELMLTEKRVDFLLQKPFQMEELQGMVQNLAG